MKGCALLDVVANVVADFEHSDGVDHRTTSCNKTTTDEYYKDSGVVGVNSNFRSIFQTVLVCFPSPRIHF